MTHPIKLAFAVGVNNEFGNGDGLPWGKPLKGDMEAFKEFTKGCVLVMGQATFASLPKALVDLDRNCVVISRDSNDAIRAKNGDLANEYLKTGGFELKATLTQISDSYNKPVCVIGGASLVEQTSHIADNILFSTISRDDMEEMPSTVKLNTNNMGTYSDSDSHMVMVKGERRDSDGYMVFIRLMERIQSPKPKRRWYE